MQFKVVFGSYDVLRVRVSEGHFSEQVQQLLDEGWELRGELKTHMHIFETRAEVLYRVTLIQDMVKTDFESKYEEGKYELYDEKVYDHHHE